MHWIQHSLILPKGALLLNIKYNVQNRNNIYGLGVGIQMFQDFEWESMMVLWTIAQHKSECILTKAASNRSLHGLGVGAFYLYIYIWPIIKEGRHASGGTWQKQPPGCTWHISNNKGYGLGITISTRFKTICLL